MSWQPTAGLDTLRARAALLARIRGFFADRGVWEVETPTLSRAGATDPALASLVTRYTGPGAPDGAGRYLHTSPEFPMKRLLAAGSGAIYQVCRVFRDGESGRRHNPEFTLLEWYRPGFGMHQLMDEVEALVREVAGAGQLNARRISYRDLFLEQLQVEPFATTPRTLAEVAHRHGVHAPAGMPDDDVDPWLDLLLTHLIEPRLEGLVFVHDYPPGQASLAVVREDDPPVAERFELYWDGVELANGYHELADAAEQRQRFEEENRRRETAGLPQVPIDEHLLAALEAGLPDCSGVAVGVDRLVMAALGAKALDEVVAFPVDIA